MTRQPSPRTIYPRAIVDAWRGEQVTTATPRLRKPQVSAAMKTKDQEMDFAIEVFVRGHSAGKCRTFPYEANRVGSLWVMRDGPRKNPRDYHKEEWTAHDVDAAEVDAVARRHTRGRFFVCVMIREGESDEPTRSAYKGLGYRLLATEGFFVQRWHGFQNRHHPWRSNGCGHPSWRRAWAR